MSDTRYEVIHRKLKEASESNQLIVFIGAGMSNNFGFPTWNSLIRKMYRELMGKEAAKGKVFSNDELLRIPQALKKKDYAAYERILKEEFGKHRISNTENPILDEIMKLKPKHIITTNYDALIERYLFDKGNQSRKNYSVQEGYERIAKSCVPYSYKTVVRDGDMAAVDANHILLKIHGDAEHMDSLVLCEDDYLEYSDSHILMENFIKSLLINHTFFFVGYGVGDSNLKLIMKWVEKSVSRQNAVASATPKHILVSAERKTMDNLQREYLEQKQIQVLEWKDLPPKKRKLRVAEFTSDRGNCMLQILQTVTLPEKEVVVDENRIMELCAYFADRKAVHVWEICSFLKKDRYEILKIGTELRIVRDSLGEKVIMALFKLAGKRKVDYVTMEARNLLQKLDVTCYAYDRKATEEKHKLSRSILSQGNYLEEACLQGNYIELWNQVEMDTTLSYWEKAYWAMYVGRLSDAEQWAEQQWNSAEKIGLFDQVCFFRNVEQCYSLEQRYDIDFWKMWNNLQETEKKELQLIREYMERCANLCLEFMETSEKIRFYCYSNTMRYSTYDFLVCRTNIIDFVRVLVLNGFYLTGLHASTICYAQIEELMRAYVDLLLFFVSPLCPNKPKWFSFSRWDIFIMINFLEKKDLEALLKKYEIREIHFEKGISETLLKNCLNLIDFNKKNASNQGSEGHLSVRRLHSVMCFVSRIEWEKGDVEQLITHIFHYLDSLMPLNKEKRRFLAEASLFSDFLEKEYENGYCKVISQKAGDLMKKMLLIFLGEDHRNQYSRFLEENVEWYADTSLLSELTSPNSCDISCNLITKCWECYKKWYRGTASRLLADIYPFATEKVKAEISAHAKQKVRGMGSWKLRDFMQAGIIDYSKDVEAGLLRHCRSFEKLSEKQQQYMKYQDKPLPNILRLWQQGKIPDIQVFYKFRYLDSWFSFVCFPEEFDYTQFNVRGWCTWLSKEEYRQEAFDKNRKLLQKMFQEVIKEGADEDVHRIYYKYVE